MSSQAFICTNLCAAKWNGGLSPAHLQISQLAYLSTQGNSYAKDGKNPPPPLRSSEKFAIR